MTGTIEIKHLNKTFDDEFCAIEDLSLTIAAGEFVSIVGTSGCGKSTLLRTIAGLEAPTGGEILCGGKPVHGTSPDRGLMFQEHALFPWLTVRKNVIFALKASGRYGANGGSVGALLETAGLAEFADAYPHQLSGGMRQRAALIRSLAVSPDVLLLDEPLGALDSFTRMVLQDEIIRLWQARGNTMVLITHDVDEAIYLSNRIIVMAPRPGRIAEIIDVPMGYPRNRGTSDFADLRKRLLKRLDFAAEVEQEYYL
ncbi:MAG: ABC transporter ATP-binding protein [Oscillospiraceae bacterium]|nr:ABC transporter ATP-binding protein [Oscillospiraceae bacterium]